MTNDTQTNIRAKRRRRLKQRIFGFFRFVLFLCFLAALGWGTWHALLRGAAVYAKYHAMYENYRQRRDAEHMPLDERFEAYTNLLVLGIDADGDFGGQRADTVLLLSLDNAEGRVRAVALPRGTLVNGSDGKTQVRLGDLYATGGPSGLMKAVRSLLGVSVHYYAVVKPSALAAFIDGLGGIDVYVEARMDYEDPGLGLAIHIPQGYQHMDGQVAQKFLRYRSDELGDIGRVQRQHRFLKALYDRVLTVDALGRLPMLAKIVQEQVDTNAEIWDTAYMTDILHGLSKEAPETVILPGQPRIGDETVWEPDMVKVAEKVKHLFPKADAGK